MKVQPFLFGLAVLSAAIVSATPPADGQPSEQPLDSMFENALKNPQSFMFREHATSKIDAHKELIVTSALDEHGTPQKVYVRSGTMRIFRADADRDGITKRGGWYWRVGETKGESQFKTPGALVMVVRELDGTVHWYALNYDFRC